MSQEWRVDRGVRQGGVLSGLLFSIYINDLVYGIANLKEGCRMGILSSNIIAYADDIVLLAPSKKGLQILLDKAVEESQDLNFNFNDDKSKYMIFRHSKVKVISSSSVYIGNSKLEKVEAIKYLGFTMNSFLSNYDDICRARNKFYSDFNNLIRKFYFASTDVKLFLFKHFCSQFYGGDLWFHNKGSNCAIRQFAFGYHKAVKKLLGLSTHESNHFACQEATLFTFEHLLNKIKILSAFRFFNSPCRFVEKISCFLNISSVLLNEIRNLFSEKYEAENIFDQDRDAIVSRMQYVQNHEERMREGWD